MRRRARCLATTVVVVAAIAAVAHAALTVTGNPATTQTAPASVPLHILVSVRNTSAQPVTIMAIGTANAECPAEVTLERSGGGPVGTVLDPGAQVQYLVRAPNGVLANRTCLWDVTFAAPLPPEQFATTFRTTGMPGSGATGDAQPLALDFGAPATFEIQDVLFTSYQALAPLENVTATISGAGDVRFSGTCDGQLACNVGTVPARGTVALKARCQRTAAGTATGTIEWRAGTQPIAVQSYACAQAAPTGGAAIALVDPSPIVISGPQGQRTPPRGVGVDASGSNGLAGATLAGAANIAFDPAFCATASCSFTPARPLPATVPVTCTPGAAATSATLTVQGANGSADTDTATVQCLASTSGPAASVSPTSIAVLDTRVGLMSAPQPLTVANTGSATLDFAVALGGAFASDWLVDECVAPVTCAVAPGSVRTIRVRFAPTAHELRPATLDLTSNGGNRSVTLGGRGVGGVLEVVVPEDLAIDFGTIGLNEVAHETIEFANAGNLDLVVDVGDPGAPFAVAQSSVAVEAGATAQLAVQCSAGEAGGPFEAALTLVAPDAYRQETAMIALRCAIANTSLRITPDLTFGEVRKGAMAEPIEVVLENAGAEPVTVEQMRLSTMPVGLAFEPPALPLTLAPGESVTGGVLALDTARETDLAGADLVVVVDGETLRRPIEGTVVVPSAYVAPAQLDLGTACVGTPVMGQVRMVNNGSATLLLQAPILDDAFTFAPAASAFPKELRAGTAEAVTVSPTTSRVGLVEGTLQWDVDLETAPFQIPVRLRYIDAGTGISPGALAFGTVELETRSFVQTITLENCNATPVIVSVRGVRAAKGPAAAWEVQPVLDGRELAPHDKLTVSVAFAPARPGTHVGYLQLDVDGAPSEVELVGDAVGYYVEPTSFYACGCGSAGAPGDGWPVIVAVALVIARRRRRRC